MHGRMTECTSTVHHYVDRPVESKLNTAHWQDQKSHNSHKNLLYYLCILPEAESDRCEIKNPRSIYATTKEYEPSISQKYLNSLTSFQQVSWSTAHGSRAFLLANHISSLIGAPLKPGAPMCLSR